MSAEDPEDKYHQTKQIEGFLSNQRRVRNDSEVRIKLLYSHKPNKGHFVEEVEGNVAAPGGAALGGRIKRVLIPEDVSDINIGPLSHFSCEKRLIVTILVEEDDHFIVVAANHKISKGTSYHITQNVLDLLTPADRRIYLNTQRV